MSGGGTFYYVINETLGIRNSNGNFYVCQKEQCQLWIEEIKEDKFSCTLCGRITIQGEKAHCGLIKESQ